MNNNELITCGICGKTDPVCLVQHIRDEHQIAPNNYVERYPNAPLYTTGFANFLLNDNIRIIDGKVKSIKSIYGVEFVRDVATWQHVPPVDEHFVFDPELTKAVSCSLLHNDRMLFVGPTGCGKSSMICQVAARLVWPLRRINLHGETSVADFLGTLKVQNNETVFQYGLLPTAMREGQILVLEELDAATPEILFALQGVLEDGGTLTLADNGGEIVTPHPDFRLVATANTLGLGDETSLYTGTNVLNASHLDRWNVVYNVGYLKPQEEVNLIMSKVPGLYIHLVYCT